MLLETVERYERTDWQQDDLRKLAVIPNSANFSEMGCFKTTTGLWLMDDLRQKEGLRAPACLIITTKAGKGAYFGDFPKALPEWRCYNVGIQKTTERFDGHEFPVDLDELLGAIEVGHLNYPTALLAHYDCFTNGSKIVNKLLKTPWFMVICDEAHRMKNKDTQWTRNIKRVKTQYKHIMTGTGFVNRPDEFWALLRFLDKDRAGGYWNFREYYCDEFLAAGRYRQIIGLNKDRIGEFRELRESLGPNRKMLEVHKDIQEPIMTRRPVELNATQRRMYNEIKTTLQTLDQQGQQLTSPNVLSQLNRLRQICIATPEVLSRTFDPIMGRIVTDIRLTEPSSKLNEVMDILDELRWDDESKQQVVVFSSFKDPLYLLEKRLEAADIPYLHMEQKHSETKRYEMWHDTFPLKQHQVFMSTVQLGGESINLTPASYMIFLDEDWSPRHMKQGRGRIYRPGQTKVAEIINIEAVNTIDQKISRILAQKGSWFDAIFGD